MKRLHRIATFLPLVALAAGLLIQISAERAQAANFESGSSCGVTFYNSTTCRGAFAPAVNTTVQLPPNGILDYSTVNIPSGVTVTFARNSANTPVIIRTSDNVTIEGVISVNAATAPTNSGTSGDGNLGDDGQPGTGGPGGFDGGYGGLSSLFGGAAWQPGGAGKGPGGGQTPSNYNSSYRIGGGGGGFGTAGAEAWAYGYGAGGSTYGQSTLLPLIGGSGGAGGLSGTSYNGAGGGGGGGAILIAAGTATTPATITVGKNGAYGYIYADGYSGGNSAGSGCGGEGGGGSGGAIRLVAENLSCPGTYCRLYARGGAGGSGCWNNGGAGGIGRIRLEANTITGWTVSYTDPDYSFGLPGHVLVPKDSATLLDPAIRIVSVTADASTLNVPANPTGNADLTFPTGTTTATVNLSATGIPTGSTADVHVIPAHGAVRSKVLSTAFSAPDGNGVSTATATITLSPGNNVLQAAVTYTVTELVAMNLPQFNGEYVAKIRVEGGMDGKSKVTYITATGKEYPADKAKV